MQCLALCLGCFVLAAAWLLPIDRALPGPFSAQMTVHMAVVAVAAPLIASGVAGRRLDPVRSHPGLFPAIIASLLELVVVWTWHTPALHQAARQSATMFMLEQASFLGAGLWLWLAALGGSAPQRTERGAVGVVALLLTTMHMTLLGALLALPPRSLYHEGADPQALSDQHVGGAIMLAVGGAAYLLGGLGLAVELLRRQRRPGVRRRLAHVDLSGMDGS